MSDSAARWQVEFWCIIPPFQVKHLLFLSGYHIQSTKGVSPGLQWLQKSRFHDGKREHLCVSFSVHVMSRLVNLTDMVQSTHQSRRLKVFFCLGFFVCFLLCIWFCREINKIVNCQWLIKTITMVICKAAVELLQPDLALSNTPFWVLC